MDIGEILRVAGKIKDAIKIVDLYTAKAPDGTVVEVLTPVAKDLRDKHGFELLEKRRLCRITWDDSEYYLDSFRFSHTVDQALEGKTSQTAPEEK